VVRDTPHSTALNLRASASPNPPTPPLNKKIVREAQFFQAFDESSRETHIFYPRISPTFPAFIIAV
jgi:hypothetical protein